MVGTKAFAISFFGIDMYIVLASLLVYVAMASRGHVICRVTSFVLVECHVLAIAIEVLLNPDKQLALVFCCVVWCVLYRWASSTVGRERLTSPDWRWSSESRTRYEHGRIK